MVTGVPKGRWGANFVGKVELEQGQCRSAPVAGLSAVGGFPFWQIEVGRGGDGVAAMLSCPRRDRVARAAQDDVASAKLHALYAYMAVTGPRCCGA